MTNDAVNLAQINTKLEYISDDIKEIKQTLKEATERQDNQAAEIVSLKTKTSTLSIVQTSISVVVGAVAYYLGGTK